MFLPHDVLKNSLEGNGPSRSWFLSTHLISTYLQLGFCPTAQRHEKSQLAHVQIWPTVPPGRPITPMHIEWFSEIPQTGSFFLRCCSKIMPTHAIPMKQFLCNSNHWQPYHFHLCYCFFFPLMQHYSLKFISANFLAPLDASPKKVLQPPS